jgi:hypothetical protein
MYSDFGWELKSKEGLERFKLVTGYDFYLDPELENEEQPTGSISGVPDYDDAENRQKMREERERKHKEDVLNGKRPVDESTLS